MPRKSRKLFPHGTYQQRHYCHNGENGAPCQPCKDAHARRKREVQLRKLEGQVYWYDAAETAEYLRYLVKNGVGARRISIEIGTTYRHLKDIMDGDTKLISARLRAKILAVDVSQRRRLPPLATALRIQAMSAMGWRYSDITGMTKHRDLTRIEAQGYVTRAFAQDILDVVTRLGHEVGPSAMGRVRARNAGWLPASAYDAERFYDIEWDGTTDGMLLECPA